METRGSKSNPFDNVLELVNTIEQKQLNRRNGMKDGERSFVYERLFKHDERFTAVSREDGWIRLIPNRQQIFLYRGQEKVFNSCVPSLYRGHISEMELFIERLRVVEFEEILKTHPVVKMLQSDGLFVDFLGLAQHYGFRTEKLDLTSDIRVAAFFASCKYDAISDAYIPHNCDGSLGVIYDILAPLLFALPMKFEIVGLQPFHRPAQQKAYSISLDEHEDFSQLSHCYYFRHSRKASNDIFDHFSGGSALLPSEPISTKAKAIQSESVDFSWAAFDEVLKRYSQFKQSREFYIDALTSHSIMLMDESPYLFTSAEVQSFQEDWENGGKNNFYSKIDVSLAY